MKNILIAFVCLLTAKAALAQKDSLAFDERNKYIYYQTVEAAGLAKDTLYKRALYFMNKAYPKSKLKLASADEPQGVLIAVGNFVITKRSLLSNSLGGETNYVLRVEVKNAKYRYWFTDFVFTPYKRDRFGNEVLVSGTDVAIENGKDKLDKKDLAVYMDKILQNSRQVGGVLKGYMLKISNLSKVEKEIKKISTKEW